MCLSRTCVIWLKLSKDKPYFAATVIGVSALARYPLFSFYKNDLALKVGGNSIVIWVSHVCLGFK